MIPRRQFLGAVLAVAVAVGGATRALPESAPPSPKATIQVLDDTLLSVMRDARKLGFQGRYDRLAPVVERSFNLPLMAQVAVGGYWSKFSPDQRKKLVDAFARLSIANYASRFDGYSGESFRVTGQTSTRGDAVVVGTEIAAPDDAPVTIRYIMRPFEGGWKIVDVLLKGSISELATKRSEYTSVLARGGFDALLTAIERKIETLAAG